MDVCSPLCSFPACPQASCLEEPAFSRYLHSVLGLLKLQSQKCARNLVLPPEQQKTHQQRISHLIKRKSSMTGDPALSWRYTSREHPTSKRGKALWQETLRPRMHSLNSPADANKTALKSFSVTMWSMLWVRRWHRMLHPMIFITGCTPLLCRMFSWKLSAVFPVFGLMPFVSWWF